MFKKLVKAKYGEAVSVSVYNEHDRTVYLDLHVETGSPAFLGMEPKQAKKLAKALKRAAR